MIEKEIASIILFIVFLFERRILEMKKQKVVQALLLAALLVFQAVPLPVNSYGMNQVTVEAEAAAKKAEITNVETDTLTIEKGEAFRLKANRSDVVWKSSNKKIVSVNKAGKLKGIKKGTAKITAFAGKTKASIQVTVGTKVANVNVVKPAIALTIGGQSTIKAEISPEDASNQGLIYKSEDKKVASVSKEGVVTAKKAGKTKITVKASDGTKKKETIIVTVRTGDSPIRLQDDFYQAVNANTLKDHILQGDEYQWSGFQELQEDITKNLSSLLDNLVAQKDQYEKNTMQQKIIDFYLLAKDMDTRDKAGITPLKPYIDKIDGAKTIAEFVEVLGELGKFGQGSALTFQVTQDIKDSSKYSLVNQGPAYLLPKDYIVGEENAPIQQAAIAFIKQMFVLAGESEENADKISTQVFQLEQDLASTGMGLEDRYNVERFYHPYTKEQLISLYSNCDIIGYLKAVGITSFDTCVVYEEENAKKINNYLTQENLELLKNYTKFTLYMNCGSFLTSEHYKAIQDFNYIISGAKEDKDMDTVAKELTQGLFSWEFGKLYVDNYFSEESKKDVEEMTRQLLKTFSNRIQRIDWLSDATKQKAIKKLETMKVKIGYPDEWPSYFDDITIDASKGMIDNIVHIQEALNANVQELLDSGVDKSEWIMTPQTVNACYNPQANDITFPAAILQAPFYDKNADDAQNLGGIGTVIGHEITHAFDTNGAGYDENGNYNNWWTQEDREEFTKRAELVKDYYNGIEIVNGVFQNGDMTITENIADMGAMACALEIAGDDKEAQRKVFESNAAIWASNQTDQYRDYLLMVDVHSLNKVRVNAILPLFDQFYDVFEVTKNDAMYVAKEDRVQIW